MARKVYEFYCTECYKYFDVKMNVSLNGFRRIHCPNCNHIHYRNVKNGEITGDRFTTKADRDSILIEDIRPMKSSCWDYQKETALATSQSREGFMARLWADSVEA